MRRWTRGRAASGLAVAVALLAGPDGAARAADPAPDGCVQPGPDPAPDVKTTCLQEPPTGSPLAPELNVLRAPSAPAFAALGVSPTEIQRPTTPLGATMALATGILQGAITPGRDIAIEVTPFWMASHPTLSYQEMVETWGWSGLRTLSLSFATSAGHPPAAMGMAAATAAPPATTTATGQSMAFGAHSTVLPGRPSRAALHCLARIYEYTGQDAKLRLAASETFKKRWIADNPSPVKPAKPEGDTGEAFELAWQKFLLAKGVWSEQLDAAVRDFDAKSHPALPPPSDEVQECMQVIHHRVGLMVDVAGAAVVSSPDGQITHANSAGGFAQYTGWLTVGWTWQPQDLFDAGARTATDVSALGLLRVQKDDLALTSDDPDARWDLGTRVVLAWERWGLSIEALRRGRSMGDDPSLRKRYGASLLVDYRLQSAIWVTATAGYDFEHLSFDGGGSWQGLRALLNLQVNFSRERTLQADNNVR